MKENNTVTDQNFDVLDYQIKMLQSLWDNQGKQEEQEKYKKDDTSEKILSEIARLSTDINSIVQSRDNHYTQNKNYID